MNLSPFFLPPRRFALAAGLLLLLAAPAGAEEVRRCVVADPTGTPLNVRALPNGTVVGVLANGTLVEPQDRVTVGGKRWVFVARDGEPLGWVFAAFIDCRRAAESREVAPVPPAGRR